MDKNATTRTRNAVTLETETAQHMTLTEMENKAIGQSTTATHLAAVTASFKLLTELLADKQKAAPSFKRPYKKQNVENSTETRQLITELNNQIADLEESQEINNQYGNDDDGKYILDSACHTSNVPQTNAELIPLTTPMKTLTANNTPCETTHKTTLQISDSFRIPALIIPTVSTSLVSVHEVAKKAGPIIFMPKRAFILNKHKLIATATWCIPIYKLDTETRANAFLTKQIDYLPLNLPPIVQPRPISKKISNRIKT